MKAQAITTIPESDSCYHCGQPLDQHGLTSNLDGKDYNFCCAGCQGAFHFLTSNNLENYYRFRSSVSNKPIEEDHRSNEQFTIWQKRITRDDGLCQGTFYIEGIHCASCVWLNERIFQNTRGILKADIDFTNQQVKLLFNPAEISLLALHKKLAELGYGLKMVTQGAEKVKNDNLKRLAVAGFCAGNLMLFSIALYAGYFSGIEKGTKHLFHLVSFALASVSLFYSGSFILKRAFTSLKNKILSSELLSSVGLLIAYGYSLSVLVTQRSEVFFDSITFVVFALVIGRHTNQQIQNRVEKMQANLNQARPDFARVRQKDEFVSTPLEEVKEGAVIKVFTSEVVPLDGVLESEGAELDQAIVSGEARPLYKQKGDLVLAGSYCLGQNILVKVNGQNSLQKLQESLQGSNDATAPRGFLRKSHQAFIALVLVCAAATFGFAWFFQQTSFTEALNRTICLLIVACPCALSLALPASLAAAKQRALSLGILIKNQAAFLDLPGVKTIFFDKTGTLTEGNLKLEQVELTGALPEKEALQLAVSMQRDLQVFHPVARALERAIEKLDHPLPVQQTRYHAGLGLTCRYNHAHYYLGSADLMKQHKLTINLHRATADRQVVYLARAGDRGPELLATFLFSDQLRPESQRLLADLSKRYKIELLTGDNQASARAIASQLSLDFKAGLKPEEKQKLVAAAEAAQPGSTVMVGDGINDTRALKSASIGISFVKGSEVTTEAGDVLLLNNSLFSIPQLFELAQKTRRITRQNLAFSVLYNILILPFAFSGMLIPLVAAVFMAASSAVVLLNALRLKI